MQFNYYYDWQWVVIKTEKFEKPDTLAASSTWKLLNYNQFTVEFHWKLKFLCE